MMATQLSAGKQGVPTEFLILNTFVRGMYDENINQFSAAGSESHFTLKSVVHTIQLFERHIIIVHAPPSKKRKLVAKESAAAMARRKPLPEHLLVWIGVQVFVFVGFDCD